MIIDFEKYKREHAPEPMQSEGHGWLKFGGPWRTYDSTYSMH